MEPETPWSWRDTKIRPHFSKNVRKYRATIQQMIHLLRRIDTNRHCADCGQMHKTKGPLDSKTPWDNGVAYANPMLGTIVCYECAQCHKEILPPSINRTLYIYYNLDDLGLDDVAQIARWGNIRAQRYWLGNYEVDIRTYPKIIPIPKNNLSRKEWIYQKYIEKKWVLAAIPGNREELCRYHIWEQQVFAILHKTNWVAPKKCSSSQNTTIHSQVATSAQSTLPNLENPTHTAGDNSTVYLGKGDETIKHPLSQDTTSQTAKARPASFKPFPLHYYRRNRHRNATENVEVKASADLLTSKAFPVMYKSNADVPPSARTKQKEESVYSDDLYGSGRPLRPQPDLINSYERIEEWQLSSIGNPELPTPLESKWEPLPPIPERGFRTPTVRHHDFLPPILPRLGPSIDIQEVTVQQRSSEENLELTELSDEKRKLSVTAADNRRADALIDTKNLLTDTDFRPVKLTSEELCICGDTIAEEDSSILAALNDYFVQGGVGGEVVEFKCLSDSETDIDSELDKNEFEVESVEAFPDDAKNTKVSFIEREDKEKGSNKTIAQEGAVSQLQEDVAVEEVSTSRVPSSGVSPTESGFEAFKIYEHHVRNEPIRAEADEGLCMQEHSPFVEQGEGRDNYISKWPSSAIAMGSTQSDDKLTEEQSPCNPDPFSKVLSSAHVRYRKVGGETGSGSDPMEPETKVDLLEFLRKSGLF